MLILLACPKVICYSDYLGLTLSFFICYSLPHSLNKWLAVLLIVVELESAFLFYLSIKHY